MSEPPGGASAWDALHYGQSQYPPWPHRLTPRVLDADEPQPRGPWHAVWFEHDSWNTWQMSWKELCEMSSGRSIEVFVLTT